MSATSSVIASRLVLYSSSDGSPVMPMASAGPPLPAATLPPSLEGRREPLRLLRPLFALPRREAGMLMGRLPSIELSQLAAPLPPPLLLLFLPLVPDAAAVAGVAV